MDIKKAFENPRRDAILAVLPHMDIRNQKRMAMMMKMMEMREILNFYEGVDENVAISKNRCKKTLITSVMPYMSEESQKSMQNILQILEMQELFS